MRANRREHYEFSDVWRKLCNSPAKDFEILLTAVAAELVGVSGDSTRRDQTRWREGASVRETYVDNEERTAHDSTYHPDKTEREGYHLDGFAPTVFFAVSFACCQCAFVGSVDCESWSCLLIVEVIDVRLREAAQGIDRAFMCSNILH